MKRSLLFIVALVALLCGCSRRNSFTKYAGGKNLKIGFIYKGTINDKGFTQAQDQARLSLERKGIRTMYVEKVPETDVSEMVMRELIKQGCRMIFATGSGYGEYVLNICEEYPDVKFSCFLGEKTAGNVSCYSARLYEGFYLAGIVAGLKTSANRIGFVSAFPRPEYIRGINAFALGLNSVNPDATVHVRWTYYEGNPSVDAYMAEELLILGCDVLTQQLDSVSVHEVAQKKGAFLIGCNYSSPETCPNFYLTTVRCNWDVFVVEEVQRYLEETWEPRFYWEGLSSGIVDLDDLSELCTPGTKVSVENARRKLLSEEVKVFDGPIYDMEQNLKVDEGQSLSLDDIWRMDWFVEGVNLD